MGDKYDAVRVTKAQKNVLVLLARDRGATLRREPGSQRYYVCNASGAVMYGNAQLPVHPNMRLNLERLGLIQRQYERSAGVYKITPLGRRAAEAKGWTVRQERSDYVPDDHNYRKRPVTVRANQYVPGRPWPEGVKWDEAAGQTYVHTINGDRVPVRAGDWVIRESDGEHYYPVTDQVFRATYEALAEEGTP
jgi:hypothetical protein